jgi:hypothetical protein
VKCNGFICIKLFLCRKDESHFCVHFVLGHGQETWLRWLWDVLTFQQHALQPKIIVTGYVMFWHFSSMPSNQRLLLLVMRCSDISAACPPTKDYCYWNRNVFDSHYYYIFAESGSCCHDHIRMVVGFITTHAISAYHH